MGSVIPTLNFLIFPIEFVLKLKVSKFKIRLGRVSNVVYIFLRFDYSMGNQYAVLGSGQRVRPPHQDLTEVAGIEY